MNQKIINLTFGSLALLALNACGNSSSNNTQTLLVTPDTTPPSTTLPSTTALNVPVVANAGEDESFALKTLVTLDASKSTGKELVYQWELTEQPSGSIVTLSGDTAVKPTFLPDVVGNYKFELIVSNTEESSQVDDLTINVWHNQGILDENLTAKIVESNDNVTYSSANAFTFDSQGNIYVVDTYDSDVKLWKYKSDGTLDTNFGTNGIVLHNNAAGGDGNDRANDIALDSKGNIYLTGRSRGLTTRDDFVVWKFDVNGVIDTTFANNGVFVMDSIAESGSEDQDIGNALVIDLEDNIYVTGYSGTVTTNDDDLFIMKLTSNGILDNSFSGNGIITLHGIAGGDNYERGEDIALDEEGSITVTGRSDSNTGKDAMIILKYFPDGTRDSTFGSNGLVIDEGIVAGTTDVAGDRIFIKNNNIWIAGDSDDDILIWKYRANGTLDVNFGTNGRILESSLAGGNSSNKAVSIDVDSAENVYVAGYSWGSADFEAVMLKYTSAGLRDNTFGTDGLILINDPLGHTGHDFTRDAFLDENGNWFVTGSSKDMNGSSRLMIWKFQ